MFFTIQHEFTQNSCQMYRQASLVLHWMLINYNQTLAFTTQYVSTAFLDSIILHSISAHWHDTLPHSSSLLNKSRASSHFMTIYRLSLRLSRMSLDTLAARLSFSRVAIMLLTKSRISSSDIPNARSSVNDPSARNCLRVQCI